MQQNVVLIFLAYQVNTCVKLKDFFFLSPVIKIMSVL